MMVDVDEEQHDDEGDIRSLYQYPLYDEYNQDASDLDDS